MELYIPSPNRLRQLTQIARHDEQLFADTETAITRWPELGDSIITGAMLKLRFRLLHQRKTESQQPEVESSPAISPPPGRVLYDLVITTIKYGFSTTDNASDPIRWWKFAGLPKEQFRTRDRKRRLTDPDVMEMLAGYELVEVEVHPTEAIRKYRRLP